MLLLLLGNDHIVDRAARRVLARWRDGGGGL